MSNEVNQLIMDSLVIIIPLVSIFLITLLRKATSWLKTKTNNSNIDKYIDLAEDTVAKVVDSLSQTTVEALKKSGKFDKETAEQIFAEAKINIITILGEEGMLALEKVYADVDLWIENAIEAYLKNHKVEVIK